MTRRAATNIAHTAGTQAEIHAKLSAEPERLAYTMRQFAEYLGLDYQRVTRMVRKGQIKSVPGPGRQRLIPTWAAEEFLRIPAAREAPD